MSGTLKVNQVLLGSNADQTKNFKITIPTPEDGTLTIERGDGTDVLVIDASGIVKSPNNPLFMATQAAVTSIPNGVYTKVNFATEVIDVAGNYDPSTSVFTASIAGVYEFLFCAQQGNTSTTGIMVGKLVKNGTLDVGYTSLIPNNSLYAVTGGATLVSLAIGDTVDFRMFQSSGASMNTGINGYFQGFLVRGN